MEAQPAVNNPKDGQIPYHQAYFSCCNRTVMTREDVAQPKFCPFCGKALPFAAQPAQDSPSETETLAKWMTERGFSTGHGDNVRVLLAELSWQIEELRRQRTEYARRVSGYSTSTQEKK